MSKRSIRIEGAIAFVPLTRGYEAVIDVADVPLVERWQWQALPDRNGMIYAARSATNEGRKSTVRMHRALFGEAGTEIDHADGDTLNNRRKNLRPATHSQNCANRRISSRNTSGCKGVHRHHDRWRASIRVAGKEIYLGRFTALEEAQAAYFEAAQTHFGEFARAS